MYEMWTTVLWATLQQARFPSATERSMERARRPHHGLGVLLRIIPSGQQLSELANWHVSSLI